MAEPESGPEYTVQAYPEAAIRAYVDQRVASLDTLTDSKFVTFRVLVDSQAEKVALALAAADKAVTKSEAATEKRFESVNEFREQLRDQAAALMPRAETEQRLSGLVERMDAALLGAQRERDVLAERVLVLERSVVATAAQDKGQAATWGKLGAVIAAFAALATIIATVLIITTR